MRHIKRISFFIYSCLLFAGGFYGHIKLETAFYPGKSPGRAAVALESESEETLAVAANAPRITCDTRFVTQKIDLQTGKISESTGSVPEKYVGMGREQFVDCITDAIASPLLEERREGIISVEVLSFSSEKIVIQKSYRKKETAESFLLTVEENRVVIYDRDRQSIYMKTAVDARFLPHELRDKILRGWEVSSKDELEKFLVSYTTS